MDYRKSFAMAPGTKVRLGKIDPAFKDKHEAADTAAEIQKHVERMAKLQYLLYADGNQSLLVVLQALDAGGKDGVVRHVLSAMNPQGTAVFGFKQPSKVEAAHDFLWRAQLRTPGKGEVVIFNRSHYEDVLVVLVHKLVPKPIWSQRDELINDFEKMLAQMVRAYSSFISTSAQRNNLSASGDVSTTPRGTGKSVRVTIPSVSCGRTISKHLRRRWRRPAPSTLPGS
jgi:polyphosphate kinase 2 (PPK2 family)